MTRSLRTRVPRVRDIGQTPPDAGADIYNTETAGGDAGEGEAKKEPALPRSHG